jgi:hypothetical protein
MDITARIIIITTIITTVITDINKRCQVLVNAAEITSYCYNVVFAAFLLLAVS